MRQGALILAVALAACSSSGVVSAPRGSPVPGTFASVGDHTVSPLYVGEYIGRLPKVGDRPCSGSFGSGYSSSSNGKPWAVTLTVDKECRVFVAAITQGGENEGPPSGGTRVPPTNVSTSPSP